MRRGVLLAALALSACDCGEEPSDEVPDFSILIGEGEVPMDAGVRDRDLGINPSDVSTFEIGGFDLPSPDLSPDAGDPCVEPPELTLTASEAASRADLLEGRLIRVTGTASIGIPTCTERLCPGGGICCNQCRAPLFIGPLTLRRSECVGTSTIGCTGGACDPLVCAPPALGVPATYEGRLQSRPSPSLELFRVRP